MEAPLISNNKFYSSKHWTVRYKIATEMHKLIAVIIKENKIKPITVPFPINISYSFVTKNKQRDLDNLGGTIKVINDSLVLEGIIPDDSIKYINKIEMDWVGQGEDKTIVNIWS